MGSKNKKKRILLFVLLIFIAELILFSIGKRGFYQQYQMHRLREQLIQENQQLIDEKEKYLQEKNMLSEPEYDPEYVEKLAREKYGMAGKKEKVFQTVPKEKK
jgi:cell division protein FtsB